jgi:hypothetical protein
MKGEPATVTQVTPLMIHYDSGSQSVPALKLGSYTPVVGDRVTVIEQNSEVIVLGSFS